MERVVRWAWLALVALVLGAPDLAVNAPRQEQRCQQVQADMVENGGVTGCKPGHASCFLGQVDGNRGLRGTTYFRADSSAEGPRTSPGFTSYSGVFEYTTARGTIVAHETGVVDPVPGRPSSGAVTAYQEIVSATGEFAGVTGHFFVSGFNRDRRVVTRLTGEICGPG